MSDRAHWRILPWEWEDVPVFWRDWLWIAMEIDNDLQTPTTVTPVTTSAVG